MKLLRMIDNNKKETVAKKVKKMIGNNILGQNNNGVKDEGTRYYGNKTVSQLVVEGLSNLEHGLRILGENIDFNEVKIPFLGIDAVGRLIILEVSDKEEETILARIIDDFDWVFKHIEEVNKKFHTFEIDISLSPRVIVILPQFSQSLLKRITYLSHIDLQLYTYSIVNHMVSPKLTFELVSFSSQKKFTKDLEDKTAEDLLNYIDISSVKVLCQKVLDEIKRLLPQSSIITSGGYLSVQVKDKEYFGIYPRRDFFWFNVSRYSWQGTYVNNPAVLEDILKEIKQVNSNIKNQILK